MSYKFKPQKCWDNEEPDFRCPHCGHAWCEPEAFDSDVSGGNEVEFEYICKWGPDNQGKTGGCGANFVVLTTRWVQTDYEVKAPTP